MSIDRQWYQCSAHPKRAWLWRAWREVPTNHRQSSYDWSLQKSFVFLHLPEEWFLLQCLRKGQGQQYHQARLKMFSIGLKDLIPIGVEMSHAKVIPFHEMSQNRFHEMTRAPQKLLARALKNIRAAASDELQSALTRMGNTWEEFFGGISRD